MSNMEQKPEAGDASDATVPPVFADIRRAIEDIRNADKGRPEYCMYVCVRASIRNHNSKVGDSANAPHNCSKRTSQ